MSESVVKSLPFTELSFWDKMKGKRMPLSFDIEITARCNNDCRHCYINLPAGDTDAKKEELTFDEIKKIADEAVSMGTLSCLISGGEPLLRDDFSDIYLYFKKKGLLVGVFTNATLIKDEHIKLFKKYPPRNIEVTVYGVTKETYGKVTRRPGNFDAFMRGINLLAEAGLKIRYKTIAMRSTFHEMSEISRFCRERTRDIYRFDPFLHLRYDGDPVRNEEIKSERLTADEIIALEQADPDRSREMIELCDKFIMPKLSENDYNYLFRCGMGVRSFNVGYNAILRPCSSLCRPDCVYDLRKGSVTDAWFNFIPKVLNMESNNPEYLKKCKVCPIVNLCLWCPPIAYMETGELDVSVDYFCKLAHAREKALKESLAREEIKNGN